MAIVGTGGLRDKFTLIGGVSTLCPAINSYTRQPLLLRGPPEKGVPSVITFDTRCGACFAYSRATSPPRLHPIKVTGASVCICEMRSSIRSNISDTIPRFRPIPQPRQTNPALVSDLRSLAVVRSDAMNPGITMTGRPPPSRSRATAGANAARVRVNGNKRASRASREKGGGRSSSAGPVTGLSYAPQDAVSAPSGAGD